MALLETLGANKPNSSMSIGRYSMSKRSNDLAAAGHIFDTALVTADAATEGREPSPGKAIVYGLAFTVGFVGDVFELPIGLVKGVLLDNPFMLGDGD